MFPNESMLDSRVWKSVLVHLSSSSSLLRFNFTDLRVPCISSNEQIFVSMIDNLESGEVFLISIFESLEFMCFKSLCMDERVT